MTGIKDTLSFERGDNIRGCSRTCCRPPSPRKWSTDLESAEGVAGTGNLKPCGKGVDPFCRPDGVPGAVATPLCRLDGLSGKSTSGLVEEKEKLRGEGCVEDRRLMGAIMLLATSV